MPKINLRESHQKDNRGKKAYVSLVATSACSLSCKYCYEKHELRDKKIMDLSLAKEMMSYYMELEGSDYVYFDFFGGEPLLGFDLIRDSVDWFHTQSWKKGHHFLIGTNGTILNDEIKEWLIKNRGYIDVGISIDGTKTAHDLCRSNSYDLVQKNLPFFKKYWPHQPAKMTICADTIPYAADGVIELEEMDLLFSANLSFEDQWGDEHNKEKLLDIYEEQLNRLVDYYSQRPYLYSVSPLLTSVPEYLGISDSNELQEKEIKRFCGAGHDMVVIDVDGTKYPCHRFIPWISNRPAPIENVNCQTAWKPDKCSQCRLIHSCPTCAGYNWEINGDTGIRTTFHCEAFKREVMASCLIEWKRLQYKLKNSNMLQIEEKTKIKTKIKAIHEFLNY